MTNRSSVSAADANHSWQRLARVASLHYPPLLWRAMPTAVKDQLRELRVRILTPYLTRHLPRDTHFEQSEEDAFASASLSIIVPVHDAPEVTRRCLISLEKFAPNAEIILIDDASKLVETKVLLKDFSNRNSWVLIHHPQALGHSAATGAGAAFATRPYLCLLNSDTVVTPWCWRPIIQTFEQDPKIGVAGPSTSSSANPQTPPQAHFTRRYLNDSQVCEYARLLLAECSDPVVTDLSWVSGFALFIVRSLWAQIGGFDKNLPDYGNDVELCDRVQRAGYRVVWVRNSYIHHLGDGSYSKAIGQESILGHMRAAKEYIGRSDRSYDL